MEPIVYIVYSFETIGPISFHREVYYISASSFEEAKTKFYKHVGDGYDWVYMTTDACRDFEDCDVRTCRSARVLTADEKQKWIQENVENDETVKFWAKI